ncbi:MAG: hypothetical protein ACRDRH_18000 [Pseudonocardia sp.]
MAEVATGQHKTSIPFTVESAQQALKHACQLADIDVRSVELIRN